MIPIPAERPPEQERPCDPERPSDPERPPDRLTRTPLLAGALAFAAAAHHGPRREGDTDIEHPIAVARLLDDAGFGEEVVAAALLHDVVEDTRTAIAEIRARFGEPVAGLVATMTEDAAIATYHERKAEHRRRIRDDGRGAAAIYAADKLATARKLAGEDRRVPVARLAHFRRTLDELSRAKPELEFLEELRAELDRLEPRR
ncbi:MAG: polyphosphate kinase [Solirubrobacteraceae bacterium]|jgi:(p)ppGpp synthase/HD superfamily hydrolase|nr:polyphosphate kinase [Solirubrobacteraceae bacterium]